MCIRDRNTSGDETYIREISKTKNNSSSDLYEFSQLWIPQELQRDYLLLISMYKALADARDTATGEKTTETSPKTTANSEENKDSSNKEIHQSVLQGIIPFIDPAKENHHRTAEVVIRVDDLLTNIRENKTKVKLNNLLKEGVCSNLEALKNRVQDVNNSIDTFFRTIGEMKSYAGDVDKASALTRYLSLIHISEPTRPY